MPAATCSVRAQPTAACVSGLDPPGSSNASARSTAPHKSARQTNHMCAWDPAGAAHDAHVRKSEASFRAGGSRWESRLRGGMGHSAPIDAPRAVLARSAALAPGAILRPSFASHTRSHGSEAGGQTRWCPACDETEGRETSGMGWERGESPERGELGGRSSAHTGHGAARTLVRALGTLLAAAKLVGRTRWDSGRWGGWGVCGRGCGGGGARER